jgi:hypothetical protein
MAMQTLSHLSLISRSKSLLQQLYAYFTCSPLNATLKFKKLVKMMETKGNKKFEKIAH